MLMNKNERTKKTGIKQSDRKMNESKADVRVYVFDMT